MGEQAQYYIENNLGRQIDKAEAREIIQRSIDAGMVIQVMNTMQCDVICSCHGDRFDIPNMIDDYYTKSLERS